MLDAILIEELELTAPVGVSDAERATPQRLTVSLRIEPVGEFRQLDDDLGRTVDYFAVCETLKALALAPPRKLIETLAEEIADVVLEQFAVRAVEVELRKFILPETRWVAVKLRREC